MNGGNACASPLVTSAPRWCSRLPSTRERPHPNHPHRRRPRTRRRSRRRRDHRRDEQRPVRCQRWRRRRSDPGLPPLSLDLGVRVDREALDLRQGCRPLRGREACRCREAVRPTRLARGADRRDLQPLARRHGGASDPAVGPPSEERRRAAESRDRAVLVRRRTVRRPRGSRPPISSRTLPTRSPRATCSIPTSLATCPSSCR